MKYELLVLVQDEHYAFAKLANGVKKRLLEMDKMFYFHRTLKFHGIDAANEFLLDLQLPTLLPLNQTDISDGQQNNWIYAPIQEIGVVLHRRIL